MKETRRRAAGGQQGQQGHPPPLQHAASRDPRRGPWDVPAWGHWHRSAPRPRGRPVLPQPCRAVLPEQPSEHPTEPRTRQPPLSFCHTRGQVGGGGGTGRGSQGRPGKGEKDKGLVGAPSEGALPAATAAGSGGKAQSVFNSYKILTSEEAFPPRGRAVPRTVLPCGSWGSCYQTAFSLERGQGAAAGHAGESNNH